ncbi:MAG: septum site-determining protein MinD [Clostridia bacterium]|nr:septum site-determining protein MinD [Clostridia bacterium]
MARRIVITSGKGGVGKTTVCANLGVQLAKRGKRVVMLDADVGLNNLDVIMGIENKVVYDVFDVLDGKCRLKQALIEDMFLPNLYVLPSARPLSNAKVSSAQFRHVVDGLKNFDYVLIDCPAGISGGFHRAVSAAYEAFVVVTPAISSLRDADKVLSLLSSYNLQNTGIIINRIRGDMVLRRESMSAEDVARLLRKKPSAVIPESDEIALSASNGTLKDVDGVFSLLAENVENGTHKVLDCTAKYKGFMGRIKSYGRKI